MRFMKKPVDSLMLELARFIEQNCEEKLSLKKLAKEMLLSPEHLQKRFKSQVGVSPKEYQDACRLKKLKRSLRVNKSVTESLYEAGHSSSSRVYEKLDQQVGMTPREYQKKGRGLEISFGSGVTTIGKILIAATDRGICFIQFGKSIKEMTLILKNEFPEAIIRPMTKASIKQFDIWLEALNHYLKGTVAALDLPLDIMGTSFQIKVWKYLQKIPRGETVSYAQVAKDIGLPKAVRAVASACGRNNIAVLIPCHRVLRGTGELSGYRWGVERKQKLLELEKKENL